MLRHYMRDRGLVMGQVDHTQENSKDLVKPRLRRVKVVNKKRVMPDGRIRDWNVKRPNSPSQGSQSISGPSHLRDARQGKPPTEGSKHDMTGQYDKARETRKTTSGTNRAAERRPVRSIQATALGPCLYYLRSHVKYPEGIPEDRRSIGIDSIPQSNIRRRSLSMEALDGDPVDRSE
ncbi:uncharacterized protein TNCV_2834271 [Trichonephila clavipes]|nr:uncharacterized protein TNCV_2834271 [Trichonephila clavipes]